MPPNRARTSNAQGRQKSCSECVKAKRKCDLQPNCLRCTRQRLTCTYPQHHTSSAATILPDNRSDETDLIEQLFNPALELPFDLDIPDVITAAPELELLDPVPDLPGPMDDLEHVDDIVQPVGGLEATTAPTGIGRYPTAKSISNLVASELFESRVGYSMEQWKLAPRMMVEKNCTPWSHPNLYEELMPRSMQGASACLRHCSLRSLAHCNRCVCSLLIVYVQNGDQRKVRPAPHY